MTAVVVLVAVVVAVGLTVGGSGSSYTPRSPAPPALVSQVTSVPVATMRTALDEVQSSSAALQPAIALDAAPLRSAGKPEVLFIGAEFCPICATERWAVTAALSKFGTFSNLSQIRSANRDGDIATLDFYGSTFTSTYLSFVPVEAETNQPTGPDSYKPLETPTAAEQSLWESTLAKFGQGPGFPFIDMGGTYLLYTSQIPDTTLSGKSWSQISADIGDNSNTIGADIDASAGALVDYLCALTGGQPGAVCHAMAGSQAPVQAASSGATNSPAG